MHVISARNVNDAYWQGLNFLNNACVYSNSRAGRVMVSPVPVTTVYERPWERVLWGEHRDANPFFHLFESLWMLAGRNDATWLDQFVRDFSARFAEEDGHLHGAYGFRWRRHFDTGHPTLPDQLALVVDMLRRDPLNRRAVITMWDPAIDLGAEKKDLPCNLTVLPRLDSGELDITVFCRSNDIIWGAYGANAVHFSVLQEYLASQLEVRMGRYYQISNNYHAYTATFPAYPHMGPLDLYTTPPVAKATRIVTYASEFDFDLKRFMEVGVRTAENGARLSYSNEFFSQVAEPMFAAYKKWRAGDREVAFRLLDSMDEYCDWAIAARAFLERRVNRKARAVEEVR